jgi:hypothetical protein
VKAFFADLPWVFMIRWSEVRRIEGLEVRVFEDRAVASGLFDQIGTALQLIRTTDPRRYARICRDLKRVLLTLASGGQYLPRLETCRIGIDYVTRGSSLEVAMMIVHEATHARLWRAGFRYEAADRERIERICVRAETAFAARIPGSAVAIARTTQLLDSEWWTREEHQRRSYVELRTLGCPQWLVRILH